MTTSAFTAVRIQGLSEAENAVANHLLEKLHRKVPRNKVRKDVYDSKRALEQIMQVLPAQYNSLGIALGWCAKAVDLLALRCHLEGFTWARGDLDSLGYSEIWNGNMLGSELDQAISSSLIHSTAFVVTTIGGEGEPPVVWQFFDAMDATGDWDARSRALTSLLVVISRDESGVDEFNLYLPNVVITCTKGFAGWRVTDRVEHEYGIPAEPLPYSPRIGRPFGRSRITRPMIGLQYQAVRELLRLEGHMDIYSYPEFWLLGADPSILTGADGLVQTSWQAMIGRIKGVPDDPAQSSDKLARADVKKFEASSPEPHLAALNAFAKLFAREASLPDSSLAITDLANPTSAEAYDASQYGLIAEAEGTTRGYSPFLRRSMARSLAMANGEPELASRMLEIGADWRPPKFTSRSAEADAGVKQISAVPWLAETEVGLDLIGLSPDQKALALGERARSQSRDLMAQLANTVDQQGITTQPEGE